MFSIKPKENAFFDLFIKAANNAHKASSELNNLMLNYDNADEIIKKISKLEKEGDVIKHEIDKKLQKTFITPFDREDISLIAKNIDILVNNIQTSALRFQMLHIDKISTSAKEMVNCIVKLTEQLVTLMENLKDKNNFNNIKESIIEVNILESEIDKIFRNSITKLFDNPQDVLYVVKWKEMYQHLENTADSCEEVANTVGGVVTKNE